MKKISKILSGTCAAAAAAVCGIIAYVQLTPLKLIDPPLQDVAPGTVVMVLGASVKDDHTPSDALQDRLDTGLMVHSQHPGSRLLVTGDDGGYHRDEISVMRGYLLDRGVGQDELLTDPKGYRTYESCKNAKAAGYDKAIIVTQRFHLARALYLCTRLGIQAVGIDADRHTYVNQDYFWARDLLASFLAWIDINIWRPAPPA